MRRRYNAMEGGCLLQAANGDVEVIKPEFVGGTDGCAAV